MTADHLLDGHLHRICGGRYQRAAERVTVRLSGMHAEVDREIYRCVACGDEQRTVQQRESAERDAVAQMRESHALLSPREIRKLRDDLGLSAAQLGELLYGVPKGIVDGWERGRYLQNREADALIRSLRDPDVLARRAAKAGVALREPGAPDDDVAGDAASRTMIDSAPAAVPV